jgi:hypothetical protein
MQMNGFVYLADGDAPAELFGLTGVNEKQDFNNDFHRLRHRFTPMLDQPHEASRMANSALQAMARDAPGLSFFPINLCLNP